MKNYGLVIPALLLTLSGCTVYMVPSNGPAPNSSSQGRSTAVTLGVPPGHLPPPGQCRVWVPGTPPGRQARPRTCSQIENSAPPGSMILYRPGRERRIVRVRYMDEREAGIVVRIRIFDAGSLEFIREEDVPGRPRVEQPMERNTPDDPRETPRRRQAGE
ncbi:MAG: hypothetical protein OEY63_00695, partial [Gemmatimonadota bacterium]|nr:hypothetical protein [Gemmatimonadota bacterium]